MTILVTIRADSSPGSPYEHFVEICPEVGPIPYTLINRPFLSLLITGNPLLHFLFIFLLDTFILHSLLIFFMVTFSISSTPIFLYIILTPRTLILSVVTNAPD